jgi:hypothetical protein
MRGDARFECGPQIGAVLEICNHHETAAEQIDLHLDEAGGAQTVEHFRPDAAVVLAIGLDHRVVLEINRQHLSQHGAGSIPETP